ncbi:uncharacterized protein BCR38DRAFT_68129 [Pseudomassariella vexata]|uniref:AB hydrolase-1 domain-containing protein n=1 Tax=Pseudomassariella vexata TaxID=1141098 RepID=A0A1Y2DHH6_9PEZI|nr:uncharacterized protein BCR38DRAFT_68129 [Pseudomassariella vexata]ORY58697.1 hypothetical protein BCR38DRAFT_68129 [Pseudomassariella vexata]
MQHTGAAFLDSIGKPEVLLGHSQGGVYPPLIADVRPALTRASNVIEPAGPLFEQAVASNSSARAYGMTGPPLTYSPPLIGPCTVLVKRTK